MTTDNIPVEKPPTLEVGINATIADSLQALINRVLKKCPALQEVESSFYWHHPKIDVLGVAAYATEFSYLCGDPADLIAFWLSGFCRGYDFGTQDSCLSTSSGPEAWRDLVQFRTAATLQF